MTGWTITWGGRSWTDDDVLAADLASVQILIGGSWENCEPFAGPIQLMAMIAALECRTSGRDLDEVMDEIRNSPATEVTSALTTRVAEPPPLTPPAAPQGGDPAGDREPRDPAPVAPAMAATVT